MMTRKDELELLKYEVELLQEAKKMLTHSYSICTKIGIKDKYDFDQLDRFEALTSRFARSSDLIIQKTFRLIDIIELETTGSIIDRLNRAEKRGFIESATQFIEIRRLRNQISHEYIPEVVEEIYVQVLELTPVILETKEKIITYAKKITLNYSR